MVSVDSDKQERVTPTYIETVKLDIYDGDNEKRPVIVLRSMSYQTHWKYNSLVDTI